MTIDANLMLGMQVGFVCGVVAGGAITVVAVRLVWRAKLKIMRDLKRGGYAGEQQE